MMSNCMGVPGAIRSSGSGAAPVFWEPLPETYTPPGFALQEQKININYKKKQELVITTRLSTENRPGNLNRWLITAF